MAIRKWLQNHWGRFSKTKVVFFDVGGTLVYSDLKHLDLLHQALVIIGYKVAREEVLAANDLARRAVARRRRRHASGMDTGQASRMWLEHLTEALNLDLQGKDLEQELAVAIRQIETSGPEKVDPDAPPLLAGLLERGVRLGIISNWPADLPQYLERHGLAMYFEAIIASEAVGTAKPHREIFLKGLSAMGCSPRDAVHVGDDYWADVVGARDIGMRAILIDRDGEDPHADCPTIARLREIESLV
ncbi:MAG: HAD family hydrolase [Planctomycetota bacterium]|nr:HAD family hydrolase [Planctomycetota bacterium]